VGDFYHVMVNFETEEDITLTEMSVAVDSVEVETVIMGGGASDMMDSRDLMQSQNLDDALSFKSTNISMSLSSAHTTSGL
jgi:hypothetical protein